MPLLKKEIVPEGTFLVNSPNGRVQKSFSKEYLDRIAKTGNTMIASGLKIPAPWGHNKEAIPKISVNDKTDDSPASNAGYLAGFVVENDPELKKNIFFGYFDLPGSDTETDSPYYKAKNTAKEVSISLKDEFVDGRGQKWNDAPMHVALVNFPVVPGQKGFEDVPTDSYVVNMSLMEDSPQTSTLISSIKQKLKTAFQLVIPDGSPDCFLRDLYVAVSQFDKEGEKEDNPQVHQVPIYLSTGDTMLTLDQAKSIVATNAVNPATQKPYTLKDLGFQEQQTIDMSTVEALNKKLAEKDNQLTEAASIMKTLINKMANDVKQSITERFSNIVAKGIMEREAADQLLKDKLEFQMSLKSDGTVEPHPLEVTLSALEKVAPSKPQATANSFFGGTVQAHPFQSADQGNALPAKDMQERIMNLLRRVN